MLNQWSGTHHELTKRAFEYGARVLFLCHNFCKERLQKWDVPMGNHVPAVKCTKTGSLKGDSLSEYSSDSLGV